jgi:hypothetical protein
MLVIYEAIAEDKVQRELGEKSHQILWPEVAPVAGEVVSMGADDFWVIVEVQTYQTTSGQPAYLCLVHPQDAGCPPRADWFPVRCKRDFPDVSFSLQVGPDQQVLELGSDSDGQPPSGRLSDYHIIPGTTRATESPSKWVIFHTTHYRAIDANAVYAAINFSLCMESAIDAVTA